MKERRSLIEGLAATPDIKDLESAFVFGAKLKPEPKVELVEEATPSPIDESVIKHSQNPVEVQPKVLPHMTGRITVSTRCRPEVATALKRASLQRQLSGVEPFYVQDIMEEALETWLRNNGYVS